MVRQKERVVVESVRKRKKKMGFITIMPPVIRAKICKNATGLLNSSRVRVEFK